MGKKRISDTFPSIRNSCSFFLNSSFTGVRDGTCYTNPPRANMRSDETEKQVGIKILAMFYGHGKVTLAVLSRSLLIRNKIKDNNISQFIEFVIDL